MKAKEVYTKEAVNKAIKLIQYGSSNKRKYCDAKDLIVGFAQLYVGGNVDFVEKDLSIPELIDHFNTNNFKP